jgi:hypothetical protein
MPESQSEEAMPNLKWYPTDICGRTTDRINQAGEQKHISGKCDRPEYASRTLSKSNFSYGSDFRRNDI